MIAHPTGRRLTASTLTLALGTVSGAIAWWAGLALPWMLGPMIGTTLAAMLNLPIRGPARLRPVVVPVIGVMLGSGFHPGIFEESAMWLGTFAVLPLFLLVAGALSFLFYRRLGGYDRVTAYFSGMPGGLNEMILMGAERGGLERRIALAHSCRILVVVTFVGLFFGAALGVDASGTGAAWTALGAPTPQDWALLAGSAALGAWGAARIGLPAAPIMGPMILSGITHYAGLVAVPPPSVLIIGAQIVIGTTIGSRFIGAGAREIGHDLMLATGSSILMIASAVAASQVVAATTGLPLTQVFLAFSPGGLAEMGLLAVAMGQDVSYVSAMHLARIMVVIFAAAPVFNLLGRRGPPKDRG